MAARDLVLRYPARSAPSRVHLARGALARLGALTRAATRAPRVVVISDRNVAPLYARAALGSLERARIDAALVVVAPGERSKRVRVLERLWERLAVVDLGRGDAIVALGGGVVGDLAGFAAATWLRGVAWVGVPTSLLAQVDSSVGGKTGIDLAAGKNLVGAFHQPAAVVVDPDLLRTLPARERRAGLAEVVKMGIAVDAPLFRWAERHAAELARGDVAALSEAVARSIRAKARVVQRDEREAEGGGRTALNYGHTLGHALEAALGYRGLRHGEAVAIGMRAAAALSARVAGLAESDRARQDALLDRLGLPRRIPRVRITALFDAMRRDKKRASGAGHEVRWVLTPRLGDASVPRAIDARLVRAALIELGARI